jgi:hypothetical protein
MDRQLFKYPWLTITHIPAFSCPSCAKGQLCLVEDSLIYSETARSRRNQAFDESGPEDLEYTFNAALTCNDKSCGETVRVTGKGSPEETEAYDQDGYPYLDLEDRFTPLFFHPALMLFQPPRDTPDVVVAQLKRSFQLFFCDPSAAANRLRSAIEYLLTELRVQKSVSGRGSRLLSLHERISKVPNKYQAHTDLFLAVKWLGNAGSHRNGLKADDILDGYEITEHVLTELYQNKAIYVRTIAEQINRRKGPRGPDSPRKRSRPTPEQPQSSG